MLNPNLHLCKDGASMLLYWLPFYEQQYIFRSLKKYIKGAKT